MLPQAKIDEIVAEVATAYLTREIVERVMSEPTIDSEGEEAVRITIVIKPDGMEKLKGRSGSRHFGRDPQQVGRSGRGTLSTCAICDSG